MIRYSALFLLLSFMSVFASLSPAPIPDQVVIRELRQRLAVLEDATPHASEVGSQRHAETIEQLAGLRHLVELADAANVRRIGRLALQEQKNAAQESRAENARRLQVFTASIDVLNVALLMLLFKTRRKP